MSDMYRDHLLDHIRRPRNHGVIENTNLYRHEANPSCGDVIDVYLRTNADGLIEGASFTGRGCVISQASASIVIEAILGKSKSTVLAMGPKDVVGLLGVEPGPMRMNCALLPLAALHKALC